MENALSNPMDLSRFKAVYESIKKVLPQKYLDMIDHFDIKDDEMIFCTAFIKEGEDFVFSLYAGEPNVDGENEKISKVRLLGKYNLTEIAETYL